MKRISFIVLVVAILAAMLLSGCSSTSSKENGDYYASAGVAEEAPAADGNYSSDTSGTATSESGGAGDTVDYDTSVLQPDVDRKIVYYGTISAQTTNYEEDYNAILAKLNEMGGYVQNVSSSGTKPEDWQDTGRYAQMTLRVPNTKFSEFMKYLGGLGETLSTSMSGEDISLQYYNTEQKIESLRKREERLQALLDKASTMEDIIELENALADVSDQIEALETQQRDYDSLIDFSTVTITLQEVNVIDKVTPSEKTLGERITSGFYSVMNFLADFGEGLLVFLIASFPIMLILGAIAVIIVLIVKASQKAKRKRASRNNNQGPMGGSN